jgi:hypothetical protein
MKMMNLIRSFPFWWGMWFLLNSLLAGFLICQFNKLQFIDSFFLAASAMTGAGLATIPMYMVNASSFCITSVLMIAGSSPFTMLCILCYRLSCLDHVLKTIELLRKKDHLPSRDQLKSTAISILEDYDLLRKSMVFLIWLVLSYLLLWLIFGAIFLYIFLELYPRQPELIQRGFSNLDNALYIAVSAFCNTGLTLTTNSLVGIRDNVGACIVIALLILAGNSAFPVFLRLTAISWKRCSANPEQHRIWDFILTQPHRLCSHLFSSTQTWILWQSVLILASIQYVFFLGSTMNRQAALIVESRYELAVIGFFQTLSIRSAGFHLIDLRRLNQGLLVIYVVMMYLSSYPFIQAARSTSSSYDNNNTTTTTSNNHNNNNHHQNPAFKGPSIKASGFKLLSTNQESVDQLDDSEHTEDDDHHINNNNNHHHQSRQQQKQSLLPSSSSTSSTSTSIHDQRRAYLNITYHYLFQHSFGLFLATLICAYSEDHILSNPTIDVNVWYIIFELVSAHGSVGLSLGVANGADYSLSGAFTSIGKLVVIAMMFLGKFKGLPLADDEAIDCQYTVLTAAAADIVSLTNPAHYHTSGGLDGSAPIILV